MCICQMAFLKYQALLVIIYIDLMLERNTLFNESFYQIGSARTQAEEDSEYCPWSEEVQNFRKQPLYKPKQQPSKQQRRYTSQLDNYSPKATPREEQRERDSLLPFNSVTIQYSSEPIKQHSQTRQNNKIKLPVLPKRNSLHIPRTIQADKQSNWGLLGENKRNSLKRYTTRLRCDESPPQFQIYKRSLIAARKFLLNAANNPQAAIDYLRNM